MTTTDTNLTPSSESSESRQARRKSFPDQQIFDDSLTQQYQLLLSRLEMMGFGPNTDNQVIGLTSSTRGEGVTSVACNFALFAADCKRLRVLLVDANVVHPHLHQVFETNPSPGLTELAKEHLIEDCLIDFSRIPFKAWPAHLKNAYRRRRSSTKLVSSAQESKLTLPLGVMPLGGQKGALKELVNGKNEDFVNNVFREFDLVIVDLPAMDVAVPGGLMPSQVDGVLYVVQAESTIEPGAKAGIQKLKQLGANILGVVFNQKRSHLPNWIERRLGE